jgi:spore germination protein YaaH
MKRKVAALLLSAVAFCAPVIAHAQKTLFYMTGEGPSERDFLLHRSKIDIIVPTWYDVDEDGLVGGAPNPLILKAAKESHDSVVPIVSLMNKDKVHKLLGNTHAQDEMIAALIRECRNNGYDGFQFDLEDIMWTDRDALSAMVAKTADALHAQHLQLQIAVVPNAPGYPGHTAFGRWIFQEWRGAFDLTALGKSVDLLCLMTYDQHTRWTVPGPVGGWNWTTMNMNYALERVPREKLSLGIALYGYHWYTGDPGLDADKKEPHPTADYISAANARSLRDSYGGQEQWDPVDHSAWFFFYRDQMREWIFYTDKRGYNDRWELAKQNHLAGTCAWVLGQEDQDIWSVLPEHK